MNGCVFACCGNCPSAGENCIANGTRSLDRQFAGALLERISEEELRAMVKEELEKIISKLVS